MGGIPELRTGLVTLAAQQPADEPGVALDAVLRGRDLPTVPVLPRLGSTLLAQMVGAFEGVAEYTAGRVRVDPSVFGVRPAAARSADTAPFGVLELALRTWTEESMDLSAQALRVDMLGPVTLATTLLDSGLARATALDAARMAAVYRSEALVAACRRAGVLAPLVVVMVEPRLVGSAHPTFALSAREVRSLLDPVVDSIDSAAGTSDVVIGIHVPGRSDLRTIISSGISLLSTPVDAALAGWAPWIQALLDNGGHVAWGAVPVDRPLGTHAELLWRHLRAVWRDLESAGVDARLLLRRSLVTTGDGLDRFAQAQMPGVLALLDELGERVGQHAAATMVPSLA